MPARLLCVFSLLPVLAGVVHAGPFAAAPMQRSSSEQPLRIAISGLTHGHVHGFMQALAREANVELVGVFDESEHLRSEVARRYELDATIMFADLETMLDVQAPAVVATFTSTAQHLQVVEASAPRGIHVMVEKPLATDPADAQRMAELSRAHGTLVLVNYETTWYPSTWHTGRVILDRDLIGTVRKIVVHDGHEGPKEIGVGPEFLEWLVDPDRNGAGALYDFGCYGANLTTWLLDMQWPIGVTAVTQQLKNDPVYRRVDDEATVVLTYPEAQVIIQASWNWPYSRKDMEVYGENGYVHALDAERMRIRIGDEDETASTADASARPFEGPLAMLKAVIMEGAEPDPLSSLENNLIVTHILDAARRSAATGTTVRLRD